MGHHENMVPEVLCEINSPPRSFDYDMFSAFVFEVLQLVEI